MAMTVQEIKALLAKADAQEFAALERSLSADARKGVRNAVEVCRRRLQAQAEEQARLDSLYAFDAGYAQEGAFVVGLDEVGRGAVAGPLAVGAVVLPAEPHIPLLNDSKQLTPQQRADTAQLIKESALAYTVCFIPPHEIDRDGMSLSLRRAFSQAITVIQASGITICTVLLDGNPLHIDGREVSVVKGDSKSASIAAASIVAKVTRDEYMVQLSSTYPEYGFAQHKGYGSAEHIQAIGQYGLSDVHRASFCRSFNQPTLF